MTRNDLSAIENSKIMFFSRNSKARGLWTTYRDITDVNDIFGQYLEISIYRIRCDDYCKRGLTNPGSFPRKRRR